MRRRYSRPHPLPLVPQDMLRRLSREDRRELLLDEDPLALWIEERVTVDYNAVTPTADLFADYAAWRVSEGLRPWSLAKFSREMGLRGFEGCRHGVARSAHRWYVELRNPVRVRS